MSYIVDKVSEAVIPWIGSIKRHTNTYKRFLAALLTDMYITHDYITYITVCLQCEIQINIIGFVTTDLFLHACDKPVTYAIVLIFATEQSQCKFWVLWLVYS